MRIIEIKAYRFNELSDTAKENAREWYRSLGDDDWWFTYEYLKELLEESCKDKSSGENFADILDSGNYDENLQEIFRRNIIYSVKINSLDTYTGICDLDVSYSSDDLLDHIIETQTHFTKPQEKFLKKMIKAQAIELDGYESINYENYKCKDIGEKYKNYFIGANVASRLIDDLREIYEDLVARYKADLESFCINYMRDDEDYRNSDEYIDEAIEANEYEFVVGDIL